MHVVEPLVPMVILLYVVIGAVSFVFHHPGSDLLYDWIFSKCIIGHRGSGIGLLALWSPVYRGMGGENSVVS